MQPVLVKSQEPDLREAWKMYKRHRDLPGRSGNLRQRSCQSGHNAEPFVSIIRAPAVTAHKTPCFPNGFIPIRREALRNSSRSLNRVHAGMRPAQCRLPPPKLWVLCSGRPAQASSGSQLLSCYLPGLRLVSWILRCLLLFNKILMLDNMGPTRCGSRTSMKLKEHVELCLATLAAHLNQLGRFKNTPNA